MALSPYLQHIRSRVAAAVVGASVEDRALGNVGRSDRAGRVPNTYPKDDKVLEVRWFTSDELGSLPIHPLTTALLRQIGRLDSTRIIPRR